METSQENRKDALSVRLYDSIIFIPKSFNCWGDTLSGLPSMGDMPALVLGNGIVSRMLSSPSMSITSRSSRAQYRRAEALRRRVRYKFIRPQTRAEGINDAARMCCWRYARRARATRRKKTAITGVYGEGAAAQLKIAVHAPPLEGRANQALIAHLAELFSLPKNGVEIISGELSRSKVFLLRGVTLPRAQAIVSQSKFS